MLLEGIKHEKPSIVFVISLLTIKMNADEPENPLICCTPKEIAEQTRTIEITFRCQTKEPATECERSIWERVVACVLDCVNR